MSSGQSSHKVPSKDFCSPGGHTPTHKICIVSFTTVQLSTELRNVLLALYSETNQFNFKTCSHLMYSFASPSKFNILSIAMQTLMQRILCRLILCIRVCITIDAMLNFDGDINVDANTDIKCEQSITHTLAGVYSGCSCSFSTCVGRTRFTNINRCWICVHVLWTLLTLSILSKIVTGRAHHCEIVLII